jgi:hypothetical protein
MDDLLSNLRTYAQQIYSKPESETTGVDGGTEKQITGSQDSQNGQAEHPTYDNSTWKQSEPLSIANT